MLPAFAIPGLFVTGTDTGVGKTTVSCAILRACRGVVPFKPWVSGQAADGTFEDVENLRRASGMPLAEAQISPLRFGPPLAPAVAAETTADAAARRVDGEARWLPVAARIARLNAAGRPVLVEGVGGLLAPLHGATYTCRELVRDLALPVLVVARAQLGTLNHTAMTVELLRAGGATIAGVVMNAAEDPAAADLNRVWIEKMTGVRVLAVVPRGDEAQVDRAMAQAGWEAFFR